MRKPQTRSTRRTKSTAPRRQRVAGGSVSAALICDTCGTENPAPAAACSACGKTKFAQSWIRQLRRVNRSLVVQVTDPHPLSGGDDPVLTLHKWWPGGQQTFNIRSQAQWEAVQGAVDQLAPYLQWRTRADVAAAVRNRTKEDAELEVSLRQLGRDDPSILSKIIEGLDLSRVATVDLPDLAARLGTLAEVLVGADGRMREAIEELVKKLPSQGAAAIEGLSQLMEQLTLGQITAVTMEVHRRINVLDLFKQRMLDERTYEIRGDGSIHRLLERAMWIVDEHYWLMHSNEALRTIVGNELAKTDKQYASLRPDFVCGTVDKRLIIIEIKRPSHKLTVADLNQLERYLVLCDTHDSDHMSVEAYLVGQSASDELRNTLKYRKGVQVRTYAHLLADSERRYRSYLAAMGKPITA